MDPAPLERGRVVAEDREEQWGLDGAGAEGVHADVLARELDRQLARHREDCPLRGGVGDLAGRGADERDEARHINHRAAAPLLQVRNAVLAAEEDSPRVHGLYAVPGLDARVQDGGVVGRRDPGVVVEHVDAAVALRRRVHHRLHALLLGDVDLLREGVAARGDGLLGCCEVHVRSADARAFLAEQDRGLAAHPAAGARDHADLSVEASHALLSPPWSRRRS